MKILYFSATGNSLCIAKSFSERFDAKLLSIPQLLHSNSFTIDDDIVGIVLPVYKLGVPSIVDTYLKKLKVTSSYTFVILNHALFSFETHALMSKYDFKVNYAKQIKMPNNYLPMFDMKKTSFNEDRYLKDINTILNDVERTLQYTKYSKIKYYFGNILRLFNQYSYNNHDKKFYVDDNCTKCMVCQKVCCKNNIEVKEKVEFLHKCEYCLACIHACQTKAIRHISEKSTSRYINPTVSVNEIIDSNYTTCNKSSSF